MPYLYLFRRLPSNEAELEKLAQRLGVSLFGTGITPQSYTLIIRMSIEH